MKISVIVPTRKHLCPTTDRPYFERALSSVEGQIGRQPAGLEIAPIVGFDPSPVPLGQAKTVNEAVARADGHLLAFLEDDDLWDPQKLAVQLPLLERFDLVTCNQQEVDERGLFVRISYYPTPSGWLMRRPTWERVGGFDEGLQFHVDSDWLGRANQAGLRRVHVVQARADAAVDNWRGNMRFSTVVDGPRPVPLVTRTVREASISGRIGREKPSWSRSELDFQTIRSRFGEVPW